MDIAGLENTAQVGLVRRPRAKTLDRRRLVAEGFKEGIGELCGVKGLLREVGDGLFDFYCIHCEFGLCGGSMVSPDEASTASAELRGATL